MSLPSILMLHGAWHVIDYMQDLASTLQSQGHKVYLPQMPSTGGGPHILLDDDVRVVRNILAAAIADGEDIVIFAHSYGGVVATEAVLAEYGKKFRSMTGAKGGVVHALYVSAFLLMPGQSLMQCLTGTTDWGSTPPWKPVTQDLMIQMAYPEETLYPNLSGEIASKWAAKLKKQPAIVQYQPIHNPGYLFHNTTYVHGAQDKAMPLELQKWMVARSQAIGAHIDQEVLEHSDHTPMLSCPQDLLTVVNKVLDKVMQPSQVANPDLSAAYEAHMARHKTIMLELLG